ncbi:MAG: response regulator transcription factor [Clostridium sp.]|uniref:response regulator transcription factor n=1 Tax=Clostridium sp. TaxID=1506 RepID=UPI003F2A4843
MRVLLVEDDISLNKGISFALRKEGFDVSGVNYIKDAEEVLISAKVDLIVLDVNLPDKSGFEFCMDLRRVSDIPIIFLTAQNSDLDISNGLDMGADDYMTKPFSIKVLISRINAILRRSRKEEVSRKFISNEIVIDEELMKVMKNDEEVYLSKKEFLLLRYLMINGKRVLSREQILDNVWSDEVEFVDKNVVPVNIKRLREKIESNPKNPEYIKNIRGLGYLWSFGCNKL